MIDTKILDKIKPGARVKVWEKIKEKDKERESAFSGIIIARKHGKEAGATFTVRAIISDIGVEKVYPIYSPTIKRVEIISSPKKVHRAKLYYLRKFSAKKIRKRLKLS